MKDLLEGVGAALGKREECRKATNSPLVIGAENSGESLLMSSRSDAEQTGAERNHSELA